MSHWIFDAQEEWKITSDQNPLFCRAPRQALHINSMGLVAPDPQFKGQTGDLNTESLQAILQSQALEQLHNQLNSKQTFAEGCLNCFRKEEAIGHSRRLFFRDKFLGVDDRKKLLFLDLNLSNKCNFKCRMCNSESSSSWAKEEIRLNGHLDDLKTLPLRPLQTLSEEALKNLLNDREPFRELKYLALRGGEPLLERSNLRVLQKFVDWDLASQIIVDLSVNGSFINKELVELLSHFKSVDLYLSIDGIDKSFSYIRSDGQLKFDQFTRNIDDFRKIRNAHIMYTVTVSLYNLFLLPDIWTWYSKIRKGEEDLLLTNVVVRPTWLNFQLLPKCLKLEFQKSLEASDWFLGEHKSGKQFLATQGRNLLLGSLHREVFTPVEKIQWLSRFFRFNNLLDEIRGTNLSELPVFDQFSSEELIQLIRSEEPLVSRDTYQ